VENPPPHGSNKSAKTKAAILDAARVRFARHGFGATTIRAVADDASIDPSMVMRYFGSKDGLYAAATAIDLQLTSFADVAPDALGVAIALHFLDRWETPSTGQPLRALLSTSLSDTRAADQVRQIFMTQLQPIVQRLRGGDTAENDERAALIASQILGFALCRYIIGLEPLVNLDTQSATAWLAPAIQHYLD
jgi:AcrR family transcriptional regulator